MSRVSWNLLRYFFPPALAVEIYGRRLSVSVFIESETRRFIKFAEMGWLSWLGPMWNTNDARFVLTAYRLGYIM